MSLSANCLVALLIVGATGNAGAGVKRDPYALEPGTRLVYTTSATLTTDQQPGYVRHARFRTSYTVLSGNSQEGRKVFGAVDKESGTENGIGSSAPPSPGDRFIFELPPDGITSPTTPVFFMPPFRGWTPMVDFPPVPDDRQTSIVWPLWMPKVQLQVSAESTFEDQNQRVVLTHRDSGIGDEPTARTGRVTDFSARYEYSPTEHSIRENELSFESLFAVPQGSARVRVWIETVRGPISRVEPAELERLRADAAAGWEIRERIRILGAGSPAESTSGVIEMIDGYLRTYPEGESSATLVSARAALLRTADREKAASEVRVGIEAPDFVAQTLGGETLRLSDLRGRVVVLDFWATWCKPCIEEMPAMKRIHDRFPNSRFQLVGISADETTRTVTRFTERHGYAWPQILQLPSQPASIVESYGVTSYPTVILIGPDGIVRALNLRGKELEAAVAELLP